MHNIDSYPLALQLLMQTDGTVTQLIKILTNETINVIKIASEIEQNPQRVLHRSIYLQGQQSKTDWLFAQSQVFLDNLPTAFVQDLIEKTLPIGTLWNNYRTETFKQIIAKEAEISKGKKRSGFKKGTPLLSRTYAVYSKNHIIMQITEKFPIQKYEALGLRW